MSFLDKRQRKAPAEECRDVLELGFNMIEIIAKVREEINFDGLSMRIGIHTGNIIGGIVGTEIIRFDLYGQDVLIANKMESSGSSDRVNVSQATKDLLETLEESEKDEYKYSFTTNELVSIKSLDCKVQSYLVDQKINDK